MIRRSWLILMFFCSVPCFAQQPPPPINWSNTDGGVFGTMDAAGNAFCAKHWPAPQNYTQAGLFNVAANGNYASFQCFRPSDPIDSIHATSGGTVSKTTAPVTPDCSSSAERATGFVKMSGTITNPGPVPNNADGCQLVPSSVSVGSCVKDSTGLYCSLYAKNSGSPVSNWKPPLASDLPSSAATPSVSTPISAGSASGSCPGGTVQSGVDSSGIPICMGTGVNPYGPTNAAAPNSKSVGPVITTATTPDGIVTTVQQTTQNNKDGSVSSVTETRVTNPDGSFSQSFSGATTNNAQGKPGKADLPEDKSDLCLRNPNLSICKNSTVSGTCGAIACDGDAIQCATLRAAAAMECKARADTDEAKASSLFTLGSSAAAGNDPSKATFPTVAGASVVQAPSSLDANGWLGGGQCFADKSFVLMGRTVVLPFSKACDSLLALRYALMVVAALASFKIISGAVLT